MKHFLLLSASLLGFTVANAQSGFTPNQGQFANQEGKPVENVLFKACGTGPGIFITTTGLTYVFEQKREELVVDRDEVTVGTVDWSAIHMNLIGAKIRPENIVMVDELPGATNYYYPHCPNGIIGVKSFHKITIKEIYPGIDWIITADDVNGVAHDFLVHENGDHRRIRMDYRGITAPITINENEQLVLTSAHGTIYEGGLKVYNDETKQPYRSYFNVTGTEVSYIIARRTKCRMVIDPPLQWEVLAQSTGYDNGTGVVATRDGSGDVLGCGYTDGADFPIANANQGTLSGQEDAVVYRLDGNGTLLWSTYFGGTDIDNAKGIATDLAGNAYITGHTNSQDLPVMSSLQGNYGGGVYDAFIAKYSNTGVMLWASWRGGTGTDFGTAITSDDAGTIYVVGYTNTTLNFPLLNPIQGTNGGVYDGFVMRLNASQTMQWSTFYGGSDEDKFRAVALDASSNNVLIAGNAISGNFPTAGNPFQSNNANPWFNTDAIVMKMTVNQSVVFASYCGGVDDDVATGVTCDDLGNIYATGYTLSADFPKVVQAGAYNDTSFNAIAVQDPFIVKCNPTGTNLTWSTYFGGTGTDYAFSIGYDQFVGIYVCGNTISTDFPVMQPLDLNYYQPTQGDAGNYNDAFIAWFNVNDTLAWSTYFGGMNSEEAYSLSVGQQGDLYVTGVDSNEISIAKFNPGLPTTTQVCGFGVGQSQPFPNPAGDEVSIIFAASEGNAVIQIHDVTGRLIREQSVSTYFGENWIRINIADLAAGEYSLSVISSGRNDHHKFVKE